MQCSSTHLLTLIGDEDEEHESKTEEESPSSGKAKRRYSDDVLTTPNLKSKSRGSMFSSCISNSSVTNSEASNKFFNDSISSNDIYPQTSESYWNVNKETFHVNGIYAFNMTEENRPIELAGKLYDIMRLRSDGQALLEDIRKDIRSILGYACKSTNDHLARNFFKKHCLRNPYMRTYSCFW